MTRRPKPSTAGRKGRTAAKAKADPLDPFIAAGAKALGLVIDRSWMPAVRTHFRVTLNHGAKVADFALADDAEPAPVFKA
jgi:1-carboxybiuret hydrolase subunit AtzG-like protein